MPTTEQEQTKKNKNKEKRTYIPKEFTAYQGKLTTHELRVGIHIGERMYAYNTQYQTITIDQIRNGFFYDDKLIVDGVGFHEKSIKKAIRGLVEKGIFYVYSRNKSIRMNDDIFFFHPLPEYKLLVDYLVENNGENYYEFRNKVFSKKVGLFIDKIKLKISLLTQKILSTEEQNIQELEQNIPKVEQNIPIFENSISVDMPQTIENTTNTAIVLNKDSNKKNINNKTTTNKEESLTKIKTQENNLTLSENNIVVVPPSEIFNEEENSKEIELAKYMGELFNKKDGSFERFTEWIDSGKDISLFQEVEEVEIVHNDLTMSLEDKKESSEVAGAVALSAPLSSDPIPAPVVGVVENKDRLKTILDIAMSTKCVIDGELADIPNLVRGSLSSSLKNAYADDLDKMEEVVKLQSEAFRFRIFKKVDSLAATFTSCVTTNWSLPKGYLSEAKNDLSNLYEIFELDKKAGEAGIAEKLSLMISAWKKAGESKLYQESCELLEKLSNVISSARKYDSFKLIFRFFPYDMKKEIEKF